MKRLLCFVCTVCLFLLAFAGCSGKADSEKTTTDAPEESSTTTTGTSAENASAAPAGDHTRVKVKMENGGEFVIELYPEYAPETCENFLNLVNSHFYDGLTFHRVVEGFMAQGGSKDGKGIQGSDKNIKGEFSANGFTQNTLSHTRGVVSMARQGNQMNPAAAYNTASSQFFICYGDETFLDGQYAAFGKVIEGMDVVDDFLKIERTYEGQELSKPVTPIVIKTMEVI